jgi:hypothetical protein
MNTPTTTNGVDAATLAKIAHISERHFRRLQSKPDAPPPIAKGRYDVVLFLRWYIRRMSVELQRRGGPPPEDETARRRREAADHLARADELATKVWREAFAPPYEWLQ